MDLSDIYTLIESIKRMKEEEAEPKVAPDTNLPPMPKTIASNYRGAPIDIK